MHPNLEGHNFLTPDNFSSSDFSPNIKTNWTSTDDGPYNYGFIVIPDGNPDRLEYTLGYYYKSDLQNDQLKTAVSRKCVYGFHEVDNVPNTQGYYQLLTNDSDSDEAWSIMEFVVISDS